MSAIRRRMGLGLTLAAANAIGGCTRASRPAAPHEAQLSLRSEQPGIRVQYQPERSVAPAQSAWGACTLPCTIQAPAGPGRVVVMTAERTDVQRIELEPGAQRASVRPGDSTLRALGWVSVGLAAVTLGVGLYALSRFEADGPGAQGKGGSSDEQDSTASWAKVAATGSLLGVVPLALGGIVLLDRGAAAVEKAEKGGRAAGMGWGFWF